MVAHVVPADIVLHANRDWRGHFRERDGGQLRVDENLSRLCVNLFEMNLAKELAGQSTILAATLMQMLQTQVYPWEERILKLPLTQVHTALRRLAAINNLKWMYVRITEAARGELLVWLDSQLEQGRLIV